MPPVNFGARREAAEKEGLLSKGNTFKVKEGKNRIRLLSECLPHAGSYKGTKNFKWLCYILDRADDRVKAYFMPHTIYKAIEALQQDPDYEFTNVPMPYDITINAKQAGTKEVEYNVTPARTSTELTPGELALLEAMKPLQELQNALKEKQDKPEPESLMVDDSEIPFMWLLPFIVPTLFVVHLIV